ncbi:hypothetical protein SPBR_04550 [Sporothrix brasiliensis 5110]|uniref:Het-s domain containing protein n=1 Tax=Sporothrix brasiliensis 5110 TaxID=1398154 RepID=A0A0C2IS83_9PEZI|nr:uncharacterized protein SPBR_04550 [Sporothrix brasiliensis 5110]KIH87867.1 hypothetical protein SPBR_04550 [Sporothrix brasiliensis 5110]
MDSYFPLPGLQLPFQRRLSRLYNDTKKSSDFVKEPVQNAEDPEIKALHRKLRIQKDRLVSWGLEWSDPSQSSEVLIDSSLSRAGLSEVVSSIMSTIKETLAEVEPLWLSSKRLVGSGGAGSGGNVGSGDSKAAELSADRDRKLPIVTWDKARFADLVRDLTVSIDTLYDLSRTRSSAATGGGGGGGGSGPGSDVKHPGGPGSVPTHHSPVSGNINNSNNNSSNNAPILGTPGNKLALVTSASWSPSSPKQLSMQQALKRHLQQQGQSPSTMMQQLTSDEAKLFESSRMLVPQQIDSAMLTSIESGTRPPEDPKAREVVFMNKQAYADLVSRPVGQSYAPLLLEYAYFDPVYSSTGIMPSMARFEKLSAGLQGEASHVSGNPRLLGYFEDMDHSRLGLVYQFPPGFHAIASPPTASQSPAMLRSCLYSLGDLLGSPGVEPKLEAKFRLAANLANAVFELHAKGIAHGNLVDSSILFGRVTNPDAGLPSSDVSQVDIRRPVVSSFDLFPDTPNPASRSDIKRRSSRLHQHPLNPISFAPGAPPIVDADPRVFDLYSLAMLLLSIGMWTRLENLVPHQDSAMVSEAVLDQLSTQCGTLYMKAVQTCWTAMELVVSAGKAAGESHLARLQVRASSYLEACCVLDDVAKLEERLRNDLGGDDDLVSSSVAKSATSSSTTPMPTPAQTPFTPPTLVHSHSAPPMPPPKMSSPHPAPLTTPSQPPAMRTHRSLLSMPPRDRLPDESFSDAKPPPVPPKTSGSGGATTSPLGFALPRHPSAATAGSAAPGAMSHMSHAGHVATQPSAPASAPAEKKRMRLYPQVALPADVVEKWHTYLMPQINYVLRHFYRSHPESVEISLESVGDSPRNTRPTVVVVCTSVSKVRSILKRKMANVFEGTNSVGLKVCTGRVMRSRKDATSGSGPRGAGADSDVVKRSGADFQYGSASAANTQFQQKPENGASIGAWIGDRHLPPVSFGGLVLVDDKPFGMTVHHMLDDPDASEEAAAREGQKALRSSGGAAVTPAAAAATTANAAGEGEDEQIEELGQSVLDWYADMQKGSSSGAAHSSGGSDFDVDDDDEDDDDYACEFSDTSSAVSESDITSEWSDSDNEDYDDPRRRRQRDDDDDDYAAKADDETDEPGDTPGVEPGYGEGYIVTQPALDDVDGNFYPDEATQDDDHLDSCGLGDVYASSGVRRRVDEHGLVHEIDWALFEFKEDRQPPANSIPHLPLGGEAAPALSDVSSSGILRPTTVAPASALPGLDVQCIARTSGLQTGRILPTITSVKIYGRTSPSHTYQIAAAGGPSSSANHAQTPSPSPSPIGIPGDSGAWIVEREHGRLCGHVLAWSARKRVAYLCPMDVLLLDIAETLEAGEVRLPGGDAIVKIMDPEERRTKATASSPNVATATYATNSMRGGGGGGAGAAYSSQGTASGSGRPTLNTSLRTSSSLSLHESWPTEPSPDVPILQGERELQREREHEHDMAPLDPVDEGFQDSDVVTVAGSAISRSSRTSSNPGAGDSKNPRWQESTKIMEMVGSMGKVRLDSSKDVQAPC